MLAIYSYDYAFAVGGQMDRSGAQENQRHHHDRIMERVEMTDRERHNSKSDAAYSWYHGI
jgi:hypothetical protein